MCKGDNWQVQHRGQMSIPVKYQKYDKGRFHKPVSRKQKREERRIEEEAYQRARESIIKWIDSLPNMSRMENPEQSAGYATEDVVGL